MAISVPGVDNHSSFERHRCATSAWSALDITTEAGRLALIIPNHSGRFSERIFERLQLAHPFDRQVRGTITESGTPVRRRIRIYRRDDGQFVGETVSAGNGTYRLSGLREGAVHYAIALDNLEAEPNFNALILDQLIGGEPLPPPIDIEVLPPAMPMEWGGSVGYRYWRLVSLDIPGGGYLEISELQLLEGGVNVSGDATVTASHAVTGGSLANLFDGNLSTRAYWAEATAEGAGFYIQFDFGAGNEKNIDGFKQGGFDTATRYIAGFTIQHSGDGSSWTDYATKSGLSYPGNATLSSEVPLP